jgi:hypothetical protein
MYKERSKMGKLWQENLEGIARQFDDRATRSSGLFHLMVEAEDTDRDRLSGPDWFRESNPHFFTDPPAPVGDYSAWSCHSFSFMPSVEPYFRAATPEEFRSVTPNLEEDRVIRDRQGRIRALIERGRLRASYFCGDRAQQTSFESLAEAAAHCLKGIDATYRLLLPAACQALLRPRSGLVCYEFGILRERPPPINAGWQAIVHVEDEGVLIYSPEVVEPFGFSHWMLLLYQLAWVKHPGSPLNSQRIAWNENVTVPYDQVGAFSAPGQAKKSPFCALQFPKVARSSFYATFGSRERPQDLNLVCAWGIRQILEMTKKGAAKIMDPAVKPEVFVSYSHRDASLMEDFERFAKPLERYGKIKIWSDKRLKPSDEWRAEIAAGMDRASIAVVLISANFLASDFCTDIELAEFLKARQQRGLKLVGVVISDCGWQHSPLAEIQLLPRDENGNLKPIKSTRNRDKAWTGVVNEIASLLQSLTYQ